MSPGDRAPRRCWDSGWRCEVGLSVTPETPVGHQLCTQLWLSLSSWRGIKSRWANGLPPGVHVTVGQHRQVGPPGRAGQRDGPVGWAGPGQLRRDGPRAGPGRGWTWRGPEAPEPAQGEGSALGPAFPPSGSTPSLGRCPLVLGFRQGSRICGFLVFIRSEDVLAISRPRAPTSRRSLLLRGSRLPAPASARLVSLAPKVLSLSPRSRCVSAPRLTLPCVPGPGFSNSWDPVTASGRPCPSSCIPPGALDRWLSLTCSPASSLCLVISLRCQA